MLNRNGGHNPRNKVIVRKLNWFKLVLWSELVGPVHCHACSMYSNIFTCEYTVMKELRNIFASIINNLNLKSQSTNNVEAALYRACRATDYLFIYQSI